MKRAIFFAIIITVAALSGCSWFNFLISSPAGYTEQDYALTDDGWELAVYRYMYPEKVDTSRTPLILCHGFAVNSVFWHINDNANFPAWLANKGWDVWVLDLRGNGKSRRKDNFLGFRGVDLFGKMGVKDDPYYWTVDDYAMIDVPTVIKYVKEKTGKSQVTWIGHSMGGMVMYAYLINHADANDVKNFVAIGAPIQMPQPPVDMLEDMEKNKELLDFLLIINAREPAKNAALYAPLFKTPLDTLYYNRENVTEGIIKRMYANCLEDIPRGVATQLRLMVRTGDFLSHDESIDYTANLSKVKLPMLLLCAKADFMAPPGVVYYAYHSIDSEDKSIREFSLANHYSANYGHCDMIWGNNAPGEVYPYIEKWLEQHK